MRKISITVGDVKATATLLGTRTAEAIWDALPLKARANRWGDEIYFSTPVEIGSERRSCGRRRRRSWVLARRKGVLHLLGTDPRRAWAMRSARPAPSMSSEGWRGIRAPLTAFSDGAPIVIERVEG